MERLPLACVKHGLVDYAERWHYANGRSNTFFGHECNGQGLFGWRAFHAPVPVVPFHSPDMQAFVAVHGAPHIFCPWGLGVDEAMMIACRESFKVYYSIDASPLRVPPEVARHFDLILVGGEGQRQHVSAACPDVPCEILTVGPEFADFETFRPLDLPKRYDLIYVACAQAYKRHDVLFKALADLNGQSRVSCLCVCGYGDLGDQLQDTVRRLGIAVDFIGPPGVSFADVNCLMNQARVGVVAGAEDGCPAVLTEYMLAGLPVLANGDLCCGLRFITPETGWIAGPNEFAGGILKALDKCASLQPRQYAMERWGWPASVRRFERMLHSHGYRA
jgi:glycosyltransferase involved in cell wall biosynthesis